MFRRGTKQGQERDRELLSLLETGRYTFGELVNYAMEHFRSSRGKQSGFSEEISQEAAKKIVERFLKRNQSRIRKDGNQYYIPSQAEPVQVFSEDEARYVAGLYSYANGMEELLGEPAGGTMRKYADNYVALRKMKLD